MDGARVCVGEAVMRWRVPRRRRSAGVELLFEVRMQAWRIAWGSAALRDGVDGHLFGFRGGGLEYTRGFGRPSGGR